MTVTIPTTDLSIADINLSDPSCGCGPIVKASSPSSAPRRRSRSSRVPAAARDEHAAGPGILGDDALRRRDARVRDPETFHSGADDNIGDIPPEIAEWLGR